MRQLADPEACLNGDQQERPITSTDPRGRVWGTQQRVDLFPLQKRNGAPLVTLGWDRENAPAAVGVGRLADRHVPKEGMDGGETDIASAGTIPARPLDVVQKLSDEPSIQIVEG
jgi:hypothetical protein